MWQLLDLALIASIQLLQTQEQELLLLNNCSFSTLEDLLTFKILGMQYLRILMEV